MPCWMVAFLRHLVENTTLRTLITSSMNVVNSVLAGFLVFQMTNTEVIKRPDGEVLATLTLDWAGYTDASAFWMLLASILVTGVYIFYSDRHERDIMRYGDPDFIEALVTKIHLDSLCRKAEDDIRNGTLLTLSEVLERFRR
ncbi:hypothetical protein [Skermanella pratensis]|uniref:hypothetical protein n=1 Tax=Skermanella pratensis TaxID=2233999 RepID=UPI001300EBB5|nr:hypothetical protein [Skermanella pratensis]